METKVISAREIQRNYRKIFELVKKERQPLFVGSYAKPEVVIMDINTFRNFTKTKPAEKEWDWIFKTLKKLNKRGRKVNLAEFIRNDRQAHIG